MMTSRLEEEKSEGLHPLGWALADYSFDYSLD